jgi:hypothetical protein
LLTQRGAVRFNGHQQSNGTAMSGNHGRLTFLGRGEKIWKLIARFFCAFAQHGSTSC